ncbi:MAG: glycogen synthase [Clostridia bacterium]|nr:glycogen synthase [Clostridia bacterium]
MKILFAASEAAPFIKSGGLGDVASALPKELVKIKDNEVCVFIPYYKQIKENNSFDIQYVTSFNMPLGWRGQYVGIFKAVLKSTGVGKNKRCDLVLYFIDNEYYFGRDGLYGYPDDGERFAFFSKAVLESLQHLDFSPDVIHLNDWQTGYIPLFLNAFYRGLPKYRDIKTVFTIHNIEYQGKADLDFIDNVLGVDSSYKDVIEFDSLANAMKCAIVLSDKVTTVSETYSHEILYPYFSHGLDGILSANSYKLCGIVNGIDTKLYDPSTDPSIPANFKASDLSGKAVCKAELQKMLSLPVRPEATVIAMISRLVAHKGMELIEYIGEEMVNSLDIQFVLIGTGEKRFEDYMKYIAYKYPDKVSANITFDQKLANMTYAGADLFLMPSKSEPCGLSQLIAMRYGTIPIVSETGGLVDTVPPINLQTMEGRGITFKLFNAHDMYDAIKRGVDLINDKEASQKIISNIMRYDSSWKVPAAKYMDIYSEIRK